MHLAITASFVHVAVIEKANKTTQGSYSCVAVNSAGSSREITTLSVFGNLPLWVVSVAKIMMCM